MSKIAEIFFLRSFLYTTATVATTANMTSDFQSNSKAEYTLERLKTLDKNIVRAVESIMATIAGCTDLTVRLTPAYLSTLRITAASNNIMINDGKTTPRVAKNEPNKPPCDEPTKVAILIAIGPGVDSDTAIKLSISSSVSQPLAMQVSLTREIIAYPPPKDTAPILRKVRKSCK